MASESQYRRLFKQAVASVEDTLIDADDQEIDRLLDRIIDNLRDTGWGELQNILAWYTEDSSVRDEDIEDVIYSFCEAVVYWALSERRIDIESWRKSGDQIGKLIDEMNDDIGRRKPARGNSRSYKGDRDRQDSRLAPRGRDRSARRETTPPKPTRNWKQPEESQMERSRHIPAAKPEEYSYPRSSKASAANVVDAEFRPAPPSTAPAVKILLDNKTSELFTQITKGLSAENCNGMLGDLALSTTTPTLLYTSRSIFVPMNSPKEVVENIENTLSSVKLFEILELLPKLNEVGLISALSALVNNYMLRFLEYRYGLVENNGFPWLSNRDACIGYLEDHSIQDDGISVLENYLTKLFQSVESAEVLVDSAGSKPRMMLTFMAETPTMVLPWVTSYLYMSKQLEVQGVNPLAVSDLFDQAFKILGTNYWCLRLLDAALTEYTVYKEGNLLSPSYYTVVRV